MSDLEVLGACLAVRVRDALAPELARAILDATLAERKWLVNASTGGVDDYRQAQLLYTPVDEAAVLDAWLDERLEAITNALELEPFKPRRREMQITVHGDGDFYKAHTDDQGPDVSARALSYLFYMHGEPRRFSGGELVIHGAESVRITPHHNSVVVFPSPLEHEVLPVSVPSGALEDCRFSVNGWLWR